MSKTKKQSKKNITFEEFKAWLSGVEDLQPDDWSPTKEQWQIIRDKIDSIRLETRVSTTQSPPSTGNDHKTQPAMRTNNTIAPSTLNSIIETPPPVPPQINRGALKLPPVFEGKTPSSMEGYTTSSFE